MLKIISVNARCILSVGLRGVLLSPVALSTSMGSAAFAQEADELPALVVEADQKKKKRVKPNATDTRLDNVSVSEVSAEATADGGGGSGGAVSGGGGVTGASTTVITREQIERAPQTTVADIIAREAGVQSTSVYGGLNGAGTKIDLRGFGASGSSNTLILVNGRRQNDWDLEGFDFSKIPKEAIERIEITRGNSGAVLYGDGAVGGVVNIVTRSGEGMPNQGRVEGGIGSFNSHEGNVSASGSSGPFSAFVNGNVFESDGYRDNNELEQKSAVGDFRYTFSRGSVYFNIAADDQDLRLPGARLVAPASGINQLRDDRRGTSTPFDFADKQEVRGTLGFTYNVVPGVELIVDGGIRDKDQQAFIFSYVDTELTTKSLTPRVNITTPLFGLPSRAIAGIDLFDTDYGSDRPQAKGLAPIMVYDGGQKSVAGYWMQTVSVLPTTDISGGVRVQWNETKATGTFDPTAPGATSCFPGFGCFPNGIDGIPFDDSETNHAWHAGIEHKLVPGVTLLGRVAESFRIANIDERIGSVPFGVPTNFDLKTQTSRDWEVGARYNNGPFSVQSTYYDMRLTDELHFDPIFFINTNLDPTRRRGVETIATWQVLKDVRLSGNVTYTDAEFRKGPNAGNTVPLVSTWTGNIGVSWDIIDRWLTLDTVVRYVGDRRMDNDQANWQPLIPDFTTVDVRLGGQIDQFFWSAAVNNIFDVEYFDYAVASASTPDTYNAYPQPGRTFMVKGGINW